MSHSVTLCPRADMPLRLFNPRSSTLPHAREPRLDGLGATFLWTGKQEYSRNESLAMLLMPKEWQRVESLRRTRRERGLRERAAEEIAANPADDTANEDGGDDAPPPGEPPAEHGGGSARDRGEGGGEILDWPAAGAGGGGTDKHGKEADETRQGADDESGGDAGGQSEDELGEDHGSHPGGGFFTPVAATNEPSASALLERLSILESGAGAGAEVDIPANNSISAHSQSTHSNTPPGNQAAAHPSAPSAAPPANVAAYHIEHPLLPPPTLAPPTESTPLSSLPPWYHSLQSTYDWPPSSTSQAISVHYTQLYAHYHTQVTLLRLISIEINPATRQSLNAGVSTTVTHNRQRR